MEGTFDHYAALGIREDADDDVIAAAYRALAKKYHPDSGTMRGTASAEKFRQIQNAYEVLKDGARRKAYDEQRASSARNQDRGQTRKSRSESGQAKSSRSSAAGRSSSESVLKASGITLPAAFVIGLGLALAGVGYWWTDKEEMTSQKIVVPSENSSEASELASALILSSPDANGVESAQKQPLSGGFGEIVLEPPPLPGPVFSGDRKLQARIVGGQEVDDGNLAQGSGAFQIQRDTKTHREWGVLLAKPPNAPYQ